MCARCQHRVRRSVTMPSDRFRLFLLLRISRVIAVRTEVLFVMISGFVTTPCISEKFLHGWGNTFAVKLHNCGFKILIMFTLIMVTKIYYLAAMIAGKELFLVDCVYDDVCNFICLLATCVRKRRRKRLSWNLSNRPTVALWSRYWICKVASLCSGAWDEVCCAGHHLVCILSFTNIFVS